MKKIILFVLSLCIATTGFAESFILNNQASNPANNQKQKTAIQWATSAKEVDESNNTVKHGGKLNPNTLQVLTQAGKINLDIPNKAEYFRIVVWSKGTGAPDFLTNWVDIVPNKTFTLNDSYLIPAILMSGTGC